MVSISAFARNGTSAFSLLDPNNQLIDFSALPPTAGEHVADSLGENYTLNNPMPGL